MFGFSPSEMEIYQRIVTLVKRLTDLKVETRKLKYGFYELPEARQKELEPIIRKEIERLGG